MYWDLSDAALERLFRTLDKVLARLAAHTFSIGPAAFFDFYFTKTVSRVKAFAQQVRELGWPGSIDDAELKLDGSLCRSFNTLAGDIEARVRSLYDEGHFCVMHGDFCFNNILYDLHGGIVRLIDPRGSFGDKCPGIFGDCKYDLAKLAHSGIGRYDYLVNGLFSLSGWSTAFELRFNRRPVHNRVAALTESLIIQRGFALKDILFITGLLFVSMAPLHRENLQRQLAMFLHGLRYLNQTLS